MFRDSHRIQGGYGSLVILVRSAPCLYVHAWLFVCVKSVRFSRFGGSHVYTSKINIFLQSLIIQ